MTVRLNQRSYDQLAAAARREWNKTEAGPEKIAKTTQVLTAMMDSMSVAPTERDAFIASMVEQLVGNPSNDAAYFGKRSTEFTFDSRQVYSADRPLWQGLGGRLSTEAKALSQTFESLNAELRHDGALRGLDRFELRNDPAEINTAADRSGFDGSMRVHVVAVGRDFQARSLGTLNPQTHLLEAKSNPTKWSSADFEAFRSAVRRDVMELVNTVPKDPNYRPEPLDVD